MLEMCVKAVKQKLIFRSLHNVIYKKSLFLRLLSLYLHRYRWV